MVTSENDGTVFWDIVKISNVNAAKEGIGDYSNKPTNEALKHVSNPVIREDSTVRIRHGAVNSALNEGLSFNCNCIALQDSCVEIKNNRQS